MKRAQGTTLDTCSTVPTSELRPFLCQTIPLPKPKPPIRSQATKQRGSESPIPETSNLSSPLLCESFFASLCGHSNKEYQEPEMAAYGTNRTNGKSEQSTFSLPHLLNDRPGILLSEYSACSVGHPIAQDTPSSEIKAPDSAASPSAAKRPAQAARSNSYSETSTDSAAAGWQR